MARARHWGCYGALPNARTQLRPDSPNRVGPGLHPVVVAIRPHAGPGFQILLDPDYKFTRAYGLRSEAPNETAYPSTIVFGGNNGRIVFAQTSRAHGNRVPAETVLKALTERHPS
jgi:hypothetical protein